MTDLAQEAPSRALAEARARRLALAGAFARVESALARPAEVVAPWARTVDGSLGRLARAFAEHVATTEGTGGLLEEVTDHAPRLGHLVALLREEHLEIPRSVEGIRRDLARTGLDAARAEEIRERTLEVLVRIARHRQRGADLVYEAYQVDIAAGD